MKTARYIGFCPCCGKDFKVRSGTLVHHGYERPGCGYIIGDCIGVGSPPHEVSPELAKRYMELLVRHEVETEKSLTALPSATVLTRRGFRGETVKLVKGECPEWDWKTAYSNVEYGLKSDLASVKREKERVQGLIDTWEPKPLTTVMEEQAAKQAAKSEREAAKADKKAAKIADYIERCQKRIDTAVRRKNPRTLGSVYEDAPHKLRELHWSKVGGTISRERALEMLDRDRVWRAFGLLTEEGYAKDRCETIREMTWGEVTWPKSLAAD